LKPVLRIDLAAVRHNVAAWQRLVGGRPVWAVVKCDAYRMGIVEIARAALDAGAQRLCVIDVSEAQALRESAIRAPIVQICATPQADLAAAVALDTIATLQDVECAERLSRAAAAAGKIVQAHVAIDTGSGWSGVTGSAVAGFAKAVARLPNIQWEGAWTHIAGQASMPAQHDRFRRAIATLRAHGLDVPSLHIASTGPSLWGLGEGAVRIGVGLYGSAMRETAHAHEFRTVLEVRAPVFMVRRFEEAMPLGYGSTYVAQPGETIVTLRIGYGEGLPKTLAAGGRVLLGNSLCPIVGNIGMNFTMVAAPPGTVSRRGDEAVLIGDVPGLTVDEVAAAAQTIPHNVITMLGSGMRATYANEAVPERV
jgi:alanine racemase